MPRRRPLCSVVLRGRVLTTTPPPIVAPTVVTQPISDITDTTATGNGNVTSDGGATIIERGVCWSTSASPTTADSKATSAGTTGTFSVSITGLSASTNYYARAYAINSIGTSYGVEVTFTTAASVVHALNKDFLAWKSLDGTPNGLANYSAWGAPITGLEETTSFDATNHSKYRDLTGTSFALSSLKSTQDNAIAASFSMLVQRLVAFVEYKGYLASPGTSGWGPPFDSTGPTDLANGVVWAGHWAYAARSQVDGGRGASSLSLGVLDGSVFSTGQYVSIVKNLGSGAPNWGAAEHIGPITVSGNTITVSSRGYKSTPTSYGTDTYIVTHALGQAGDERNWLYNMSTACPLDGGGMTYWQRVADWVIANISNDSSGSPVSFAQTLGLFSDVDSAYIGTLHSNADLDYDGVEDDGFIARVNVWQAGIAAYWARVQTSLTTTVCRGGTANTGVSTINGAQLEGFFGDGIGTGIPTYDTLGGNVSRAIGWKQMAPAPCLPSILQRNPDSIYTRKGGTSGGMNPTYLNLSLCCALDFIYAQQNNSTDSVDPWLDELGVNVGQAGITGYAFGEAIPKSDLANCRRAAGWLGQRIGNTRRVFDEGSLTAAYTFNAATDSTTGWASYNLTASIDTGVGTSESGGKSLKASQHTTHDSNMGTATSLRSPQLSLTNGNGYTLSFVVKATSQRTIGVSLWGQPTQFINMDNTFRRVNIGFEYAGATTSTARIYFLLGRDDTEVWFSEITLYNNNYNVLVSYFDNGVVVANATANSANVALTGGPFQRILHSSTAMDPDGVNDGTTGLNSVTVPAYSGRILVRT